MTAAERQRRRRRKVAIETPDDMAERDGARRALRELIRRLDEARSLLPIESGQPKTALVALYTRIGIERAMSMAADQIKEIDEFTDHLAG